MLSKNFSWSRKTELRVKKFLEQTGQLAWRGTPAVLGVFIYAVQKDVTPKFVAANLQSGDVQPVLRIMPLNCTERATVYPERSTLLFVPGDKNFFQRFFSVRSQRFLPLIRASWLR